MNRAFAIGDIHGCTKTFRRLLFEELDIQSGDTVICVGDYVDRGPDSRGVVDTILDLREGGHHVVTVRGNHEQIMLNSVLSDEHYLHWIVNGGDATLKSFGVQSYEEIAPRYRSFFEETMYWYEWQHYILVHAGLNFHITDPFSDTHAMLWTRDTYVDTDWLGNRIILHGHTPMKKEKIMIQGGRNIDLDAGCVYPYREGMGWLIAFELQSREYHAVKNIDMRSTA